MIGNGGHARRHPDNPFQVGNRNAALQRNFVMASTDTDLSAFRQRGEKVIMTYGWVDPILQPVMGVNYYKKSMAANSPDAADFIRLFMVPGMSHCTGSVGPDQFDPVTAVIDRVEAGRALQG